MNILYIDAFVLPSDAVSSRKNDSSVDQRTAALIGFSHSSALQNGDHPGVLGKIGFVIEGTGDSESNAVGVAVTTSFTHMAALRWVRTTTLVVVTLVAIWITGLTTSLGWSVVARCNIGWHAAYLQVVVACASVTRRKSIM